MKEDELFSNLCQYGCEILTYEEYHSMGIEGFHNWVKEHLIPIPKSELEVGKEYKGECRNASKAIWDGKKFWYERYKFGRTYNESINHYEDDDGYDVFVPIKEI